MVVSLPCSPPDRPLPAGREAATTATDDQPSHINEPLYLSGPYDETPLRADHVWEDLLDAVIALAPPPAADDEDEIEIPF